MEWTKIKCVYILDSDMPDNINWALTKIMCLTARIETYPTESQILKHVHKKTLKQLQEYLKNTSRELQDILKKVLEDVHKVNELKLNWKNKKAQQREKKENVPQDVPKDVPQDVPDIDKIREDKIREDKINKEIPPTPLKGEYVDNFELFINEWNISLSPKATVLSKTRKNKLKARLAENKEFLKDFREVINKIKNNGFLRGDNKSGWKPTFDWVIENDRNYLKILEGNYEKKTMLASMQEMIDYATEQEKEWLKR
jgi:hypothetical protein